MLLCLGLFSCWPLSAAPDLTDPLPEGLQFVCVSSQAPELKAELLAYFKSLAIPLDLLITREDVRDSQTTLSYVLQGPGITANTDVPPDLSSD